MRCGCHFPPRQSVETGILNTTSILVLASSAVTALAVGTGMVWVLDSRGGDLWDRISRRRVRDLVPQIESLHLDPRIVSSGMRIWGIAIVLTLVVFFALGKWLLAIPALVALWIAPRVILETLVERRRTVLRDQMVGATIMLANTARAGLSLAQGLETVASETPEPLRSEFRQIVNEYQRGRPLPDTIAAARDRLRLEGFTLFASAILVCLERGGKITDALLEIGRSLQENQRLERKLETETASGKLVVVVLSIFPFGFLLVFWFLNPGGTSLLFTTGIGQVVLVLMCILVFVAVGMARNILKINI